MVKGPVTSKFRPHISHRRGSTGDKCSALESATATFRGGAKSTSENQLYGSGTRIALTIVVILAQAALISVLLHEYRRRRLAEVQSRQRMDAHINRYSTAGELTASISHEINQPLGSILTNAETAREILTSPAPDIVELNSIVDDIIHDDRRASEVIRRMRSLLKKAPFEQKEIDFNEVVREAIEFLSALAVGRKVELGSFITPVALPIVGDRIQLQQVIINLVVNAIDAMADLPSENRKISIHTLRADNFAELTVSDRGPGIPADKLKEVFEPFFTSKAEGMGMGLSIARTIVEAHDGRISAENQPTGGASFKIMLPLVGRPIPPSDRSTYSIGETPEARSPSSTR